MSPARIADRHVLDHAAAKRDCRESGFVQSGLKALSLVASYFRIVVEPSQLAHDLGLGNRPANPDDIVRAATRLGLKARHSHNPSLKCVAAVPLPAIISLKDGQFAVLASRHADSRLRVGFPLDKSFRDVTLDGLLDIWDRGIILIARRFAGPGADPRTFGFRWFFHSIWRYRRPLSHVIIASLFIQGFALVTPLFFQVVIDKVLVHNALSTLTVIAVGLSWNF